MSVQSVSSRNVIFEPPTEGSSLGNAPSKPPSNYQSFLASRVHQAATERVSEAVASRKRGREEEDVRSERREEMSEELKAKKGRNESKPSEYRGKTHFLPMRGVIYLEYIMSGKKKFEGRVNGPACESMKVGERLKLFDRKAGWGILCRIDSKDVYPSFQAMLEDKGILPMLPQLEKASEECSKSDLLQKGVKIYQAFPGADRVHKLGVVAIGIKFLEKVSQ